MTQKFAPGDLVYVQHQSQQGKVLAYNGVGTVSGLQSYLVAFQADHEEFCLEGHVDTWSANMTENMMERV